jgi:hypothetical protein
MSLLDSSKLSPSPLAGEVAQAQPADVSCLPPRSPGRWREAPEGRHDVSTRPAGEIAQPRSASRCGLSPSPLAVGAYSWLIREDGNSVRQSPDLHLRAIHRKIDPVSTEMQPADLNSPP